MTSSVRPIPDGYDGVQTYLCVKGAAEAIEFYKAAFGAEEIMRMTQEDGRVGHAEIRIGKAVFMLADEFPEMGFRSPLTLGGTSVHIHLYVEDVDAVAERAAAAGATVERPPATQFYGDRNAGLKDPYGHSWYFATHVEDVPPDELERRAKAAKK